MQSETRRGYGLLVLRVVVGFIFIAHGYLKGFQMGMPGTIGFFTHLGIPIPNILAWLVVFAEMVGGAALILGIFTLPFALALVVDMAGAIYFAKRGGGLFAPKGFELELTLLSAALALVLTGPGSISLEHLFRRNRVAGSK